MAIEIAADVVIAYIDKAGSVAAVLELGALIWLANDRARLLSRLEEKSEKVEQLAEKVVTIVAELRMFLFQRGAP